MQTTLLQGQPSAQLCQTKMIVKDGGFAVTPHVHVVQNRSLWRETLMLETAHARKHGMDSVAGTLENLERIVTYPVLHS